VFDWRAVVRERLGPLALDPQKQEEVVEELAQQLESAYQDELSKGGDRFAAIRRSMAQFRDWEELRNEVFGSVEGTQMPLWEQRGIFAPRRPLVWICLALSLSFLLVPSFRNALRMIPLSRNLSAWDACAFSDKALEKLKSRDERGYAQALAYVALHSPDEHEASAAAEKAIAIDSQLTWISAHVSRSCCDVPVNEAKPWLESLGSWDPGNGFVYLLEAESAIEAEWKTHWSVARRYPGTLRQALAAEPRWRELMEKAFSAPRMDSYIDRQFRLDRDVLLERGLDYPDKLLLASSSAQIPDLVMLKTYADYLLLDVGDREEKAGHIESALSAYAEVASFAQKLDNGPSSLEHMGAVLMRKRAYEKMIALLRRQGRDAEAANAAVVLASTMIDRDKSGFELGPRSSGYRAGQLLMMAAVLIVLLTIATSVWFVCVVPLRLSPRLSRDMNWVGSRLGWTPALLAVSCLVFFVSFWPYANSIADYVDGHELRATYGSMFMGFTSLRLNYILDIWIDHMFWPLIWCAGIAILGAVYLRWAAWRRRTHQFPLT
jgi:hypothetical protein